MEIVEDACKVAFREQWELLLLGVTDDKITYDYLKIKKGLAVGKNWYYDLKREVYYHVAQKDRV